MTQPAERLERAERLRSSRDFQRVARQGTRVSSRDFVLLIAGTRCREQSGDSRRLGVTASRKVGGAVVRNRVKRGIREWFRRYRGELATDVDVVVIARPSAANLEGSEITEELRGLARRAYKRSVAMRSVEEAANRSPEGDALRESRP